MRNHFYFSENRLIFKSPEKGRLFDQGSDQPPLPDFKVLAQKANRLASQAKKSMDSPRAKKKVDAAKKRMQEKVTDIFRQISSPSVKAMKKLKELRFDLVNGKNVKKQSKDVDLSLTEKELDNIL